MSAELHSIGRWFVLIGLILAGCGLVLLLTSRIPWLGRLPGDIIIQREHATWYFPLASCLLVSVMLTLLLWLVNRIR